MEKRHAFPMHWRTFVLALLLGINILVWSAVWERGEAKLRVYFFDVGQGDSALIVSPSGARVLIDGGPNRKVVSELGKTLPFRDRRIDVVVATHPDADHIGGLPEVLETHRVQVFIEPGSEAESSLAEVLEEELQEEGAERLTARRGMAIDLGGGAVLRILFPNQDVSEWDSNDASVVARLDYGEISILFAGDAELRTENILSSLNKGELDTDVLKVGHHGSKTSSRESFLELVTPEYSIISAGRDNRYGHPHPEVIERLNLVGSQVLSTAEDGTIVFETDGRVMKIK